MVTMEAVIRAAISDAGFDGRQWASLSRADRERYKARAEATLAVVAPIIAAHEREACAQVADDHAKAPMWGSSSDYATGHENACNGIADAILARGEKPA